ncbi:MAG: hypothetical protein ACR2GK_01050 [Gemmatimonadaceae bacterium]
MPTRIAVLAALAFAAAASPLRAQGTAPQPVAVSPAALRAMTLQKPKAKTPMTARVGMTTAPAAEAASSRPPKPTSVRSVTEAKGSR